MGLIKNGMDRPVFGITGGMGSGKSSVARFLHRSFGGALIDADLICRELLLPEGSAWAALRAAFGDRFLHPDLTINRPLLRRTIFEEEELRRRLDRIIHPLVKEAVHEKVHADRQSGWFLLEVPLLYEAGWEIEVDRVIVVYADVQQCCRRLQRRDSISREEAARAVASQWPLAEKALRADHVIDNSGAWPATCLQALHLGKVLSGSRILAGRERGQQKIS